MSLGNDEDNQAIGTKGLACNRFPPTGPKWEGQGTGWSLLVLCGQEVQAWPSEPGSLSRHLLTCEE